MSRVRVILHLDMNSFYASVEQALRPELRGKPVAIAGRPEERRGIIITCSYEARAYGVYTTQRVGDAKKLAPHLIVVPPRKDLYREVSERVFEELRTFTPLVEPMSIDEAYIDITDIGGLHSAVAIAEQMQQHLLQTLHLPCSIGIAPNKFLAKTASDFKKPLGITILRKREIEDVLWPLPLIEMHGVGKKTDEKMKEVGIETIGDLAKMDRYTIELMFGKSGAILHDRANGIDPRKVDPDRAKERKSVGNSTTLVLNATTRKACLPILHRLSTKVSERLKKSRRLGYSVTLYLRTAEWDNYSRSITKKEPLDDVTSIYETAVQLFDKHWTKEPLRLLGVTVSDLIHRDDYFEQLTLEDYAQFIQKKKQ